MKEVNSAVDIDSFCIAPEQVELILYEDEEKHDFPFSPVQIGTTQLFDFSSAVLEGDLKKPCGPDDSKLLHCDIDINQLHLPPATFTTDYTSSSVSAFPFARAGKHVN